MLRLHASCVAFGDQGVLLLGQSGSGKSDLALRLVHRGARLVADDQVYVDAGRERLIARVPEQLGGLLEVRGVGMARLPFQNETPLSLALHLSPRRDYLDRLPDPEAWRLGSGMIPMLRFFAFEPSAPEKVLVALDMAAAGLLTPIEMPRLALVGNA